MTMKTKTKLKKITSLASLRQLARTEPAYQDLAVRSALNLGLVLPPVRPGSVASDEVWPEAVLKRAFEWLDTNAMETTEEGVVAEVNFCR